MTEEWTWCCEGLHQQTRVWFWPSIIEVRSGTSNITLHKLRGLFSKKSNFFRRLLGIQVCMPEPLISGEKFWKRWQCLRCREDHICKKIPSARTKAAPFSIDLPIRWHFYLQLLRERLVKHPVTKNGNLLAVQPVNPSLWLLEPPPSSISLDRWKSPFDYLWTYIFIKFKPIIEAMLIKLLSC
jgi:hypothetical protein